MLARLMRPCVTHSSCQSDGSPCRPVELKSLVREIVERVTIAADRTEIRLSRAKVAAALGAEGASQRSDLAPIVVSIEAKLRRAGKGKRLVIENGAEAEVNAGLAAMIAEAFAIRNQLLSRSDDSIEAMTERVIVPVDHRFALGKSPAFPSAPDKKSRSSVNSPILACSVFTSIAGGLESGFVSVPKTPAAPSRSCDLQVVIWFGWTSNCSASSASVFSLLIAAKATFALKAGLWFRRGLFVMLSPVHGSLRRVQAEFPLIQVVQISRASSRYLSR